MEIQGETYSFAYDDLEQLISEKGKFDHDYLFDSHNNCLNKDGGKYEVNHLNQIEQTQDAEYIYDDNGNTKTKSSEENIEFDYDALDRLIRVTKEGQEPIEYVYDSLHRRVIKQKGDKEALYVYQGQNEVGEVENSSLKTFRTLGLTAMAELGSAIAMEIEGKVYIPLYDLSLNTAELLSEELEVVESYRYSAFGQEVIETQNEKAINPWRFSSKRVDDETGYVYFGRRYYDPEIGRWTTKDPKGYEEGINLYAYGLNNPLTIHDLYGLELGPACPDFFANEEQPFRSYGRAAMDWTAESVAFLGDLTYTPFEYPLSDGTVWKNSKFSEKFLPVYYRSADDLLPYNKSSTANINTYSSAKVLCESAPTIISCWFGQIGKGVQFVKAMNPNVLVKEQTITGVLGPVGAFFSSVLSKKGSGNEVLSKDENTSHHIFGREKIKRHNLEGFLDMFGGDSKKAFEKIKNATQSLADRGKIADKFETHIRINKARITVRGRVINGEVNIGTAFIPH